MFYHVRPSIQQPNLTAKMYNKKMCFDGCDIKLQSNLSIVLVVVSQYGCMKYGTFNSVNVVSNMETNINIFRL